MERVCFNIKHKYENGEELEVRYEGNKINCNSDIEATKQLLEKYIYLINRRQYMRENVSMIRTILRDYEEKLLVVSYRNANEFEETVKYDNGILFLFERKNQKDSEIGSIINTKFIPGNGLNISFSDKKNHDIIDVNSNKKMTEIFSDLLSYINSLQYVSKIELWEDEKELIQKYKLFYGEAPDFTDPDIQIKVQTMVSILIEFNITLGLGYYFKNSSSHKMPYSYDLQEMVLRLLPFGKIEKLKEPVMLTKWAEDVISIVGETIREAICDEKDKNEALMKISRIVYARRYGFVSDMDTNKVAEWSNCTKEEVESNVKMIKKLKKNCHKLEYFE